MSMIYFLLLLRGFYQFCIYFLVTFKQKNDHHHHFQVKTAQKTNHTNDEFNCEQSH